jgi:hypothetical protein
MKTIKIDDIYYNPELNKIMLVISTFDLLDKPIYNCIMEHNVEINNRKYKIRANYMFGSEVINKNFVKVGNLCI